MTPELTETQKLIPQEWVDFIKKSPEAIEKELAIDYGKGHQRNSWLACFRTRLAGLKLKWNWALEKK